MSNPRFHLTQLDPRFPESKELIHHVTSRVAMDQPLISEEAREEFVRHLKIGTKFSGLRILAYVIMPHHFHLLLAVPVEPAGELDERAFFRRVGPTLSREALADLRSEWKATSPANRPALQQPFLDRMHNLAEFMKTFVQRMTRFINREHNRRGTLWQNRFRSALIEEGFTARVVAAYLHTNPVRAGLVDHPGHYPWSSFGKARKADRALAIQSSIHCLEKRDPLPTSAIKDLEKEMAQMKSTLNEDELLAARAVSETIRHFTDGLIVGSVDFIERLFEGHREQFHPNRKSGARKPIGPLKLLKGKIQAYRGLQRGHDERKK